jgi:ATPase subunit of ABC transporter with duplicated ATPase domains
LERNPVQEVLSADIKLARLLKQQAFAEEEMAAVAEGDATITRTIAEISSHLQEIEQELSKYDHAEKEIVNILVALGFCTQEQSSSWESQPGLATCMTKLSGGWRMKVELAKGLWLQPKLLLLDEPTNHLDFAAVEWLQQKIEEYPHTTVIVSHDISFLHESCKEILWINACKIESMPRDMVSPEDLLRMQRKRPLRFRFTVPEGDTVADHGISFHDVDFSYPGDSSGSQVSRKKIFHVSGDVRFSGTSRSLLLGRNGTGKSTFLDLCTGKLTPTGGKVDRTPDLKIGHYSQLTEELDRHPEDSAATFLVRECREALSQHAGSTRFARLQEARARQKDESGNSGEQSRITNPRAAQAAAQEKRLLEIARGVLSNFGYEGDVAISVPVDRLSGGQKALLKFAVLSLQPSHILLLDEPTNHLDAEACKALAEALADFKGGIVAVTHDELLMYRLIHCNWSTSELLVCRACHIQRVRSFGAQCLNTLKEEAHRAESDNPSSIVKPHRQKKGTREETDHQQHEEDSLKESSKIVSGVVPPWLRRSRRKERESQSTLSELEQGQLQKENVDSNVQSASVVGEKTKQNELVLRIDSVQVEFFQDEALNKSRSDDSAQCEDHNITYLPGMPAFECLKFGCTGLPQIDDVCTQGTSGHSRLRKDLVNLNKAVVKWLKTEKSGLLNRNQISDRIKNSVAACQLRAMHGDAFMEDDFVQQALERATKAGNSCRDAFV